MACSRCESQCAGTGPNAATLTITGTGGSGSTDHGIELADAGTLVTSVSGNIRLTGTSPGGGGINLSSAAKVTSTGAGINAATPDMTGTGGGTSDGVQIEDSRTQLTSVDGGISINGTGGAAGDGVEIGAGVALAVQASGSGTISISGDGFGGQVGVQIDSEIDSNTGTVIVTSQDDVSFGGSGLIESTSGGRGQ